MDAAASVIAVIQISQQVGKTLVDYYQSARDARKDIKDLYTSLGELEIILESLAKLYQRTGQVQLPDSALILGPEGPLKRIKDDLETLNSKLEKKHHNFSALVALKWPFEKKGVEKVVSNIEKGKGDLKMIVGIGNFDLSYKQMDIVQALRSEIAQAQTDENRQAIVSWLLSGVPNPSQDHNAARGRHQKGTGRWLSESQDLKAWMESDNSFIWLFGGAGAGKSILSSSVIDISERRCSSTPLAVTTYWYFTFADREKQKVLNMLLSFVANVLNGRRDIPQRIHELYAQSNHGINQPHLENVLEMLRVVVQGFDDVYIIMDGLDECSKTDSERARLLGIIKEIRGWNIPSMHIFVASRLERDILDEFDDFASDHIRIQAEGNQVKKDIELFIQKKLSEDKRCSRWKPELKAFVQERISARAGGMFRLAALQLEAITPIAIESRIRAAVESLPKTLDMFYDRMLVEVHAENSIFVYRALQWIAFAGRPLMLHELAEAVIFDPDQSFSIDDRFMDCNSLLEMIPAGLVSTTPGKFTRYRDEILISREQDTDEGNSDGEVLGFDKYNTCKIRLAHFSVKEYLVSDRIIKGPANLYSIDENLVHKTIVKCCFRYFMHIGDSRPQPHARLLYQFPLLHHASISWAYHLHNIEAQARDPQVDDLMLEFFDTGKTDAWRVWTSVAFRITGYATKLIYVRAYPHDRYWNQKNSRLPFAEEEQNIPHPITWLCFLGLTEALKRVLPTLPLTLVSIPQRGILASPLYAATLRGCPQTVSLLLDAGADINAGLGTKDLPLVKAVYHGSKFVKLFLDRGAVANVKSAGGNFPPDSPLIEACQYGDLEVVKLLLDGGADPNLVAEDSRYRDVPLMVAFARDRIDVMEMLLAYGADPDYVTKGGGDLTTPLCLAASYEGLDAFKLLLQAGASPNLSPTGEYTPFHNAISATESRAIKLINLLLEYGVEPSIASKRGSDMKTPLIYAIDEGRSANFVSFLVGLDIDINIHALHRGKNALMFAMNSLSSWHSKDRTNGLKTVRVLLEAGAYQCADPHWQRACSLARQLIDEPGYRRVYFGEDDSRDGREGNSSDDDSEEGNSSDDDSEEGNSSDDDSEEWLSEDDSEENPRENDSEENPSEEDSEENPREDDSEENPREDDSEENPSDDDSDIVVGIWAEQIRALCSLMDEYSTKRNTEAVEKMEEIVSDVAGLFMEG